MPRRRLPPSFPSTVQIFRGLTPDIGVLVYTGPAEKVINAKVALVPILAPPLTIFICPVSIYFPAGTDVRGALQSGGPDYVQWAGNPQWNYLVKAVEDVADGFANKFRVAFCFPFNQPTPLP